MLFKKNTKNLNQFNDKDARRNYWLAYQPVNNDLVNDPTTRLKEFRQAWSRLNRIRYEQGRCNHLKGKTDSPDCDCGDV